MERLWVDANVLLRFLTGEPAAQANKSKALMQRAERGEVEVMISTMIVAEVVWVLRSVYKESMDRIASALTAFLSAEGIRTEEMGLVLDSLEMSREKNVDFVDAYLALKAAVLDEKVCTFDETDFKKLSVKWVLP